MVAPCRGVAMLAGARLDAWSSVSVAENLALGGSSPAARTSVELPPLHL